MRYREVVQKLRKLGCYEITRRGGGSHRKWHNPLTGRATIIPDHGSSDLRIGTLRAALRKLGIDWRDFNNA